MPGNFIVKASQHPFLAGEKVSTEILPLPTVLVAPDKAREIESTFAFDQLTQAAKNCTKVEFVMMMAPTFGFDIPAHTYIELQEALKQGRIQNPEHRIMTGGAYPADYDNKSRIIRIHAAAADHAVESQEGARKLLAILLHEFGHHIDNVLRNDLADKDEHGNPTVAADAPLEEGAAYAYRMAYFDLENTSETVYANYASPTYSGPLKVNYAAAQAAIKRIQAPETHEQEGEESTRVGFGAGRGENHGKRPHASFGHESIEDALNEVGFPREIDRKAIYFGNWLRDYSQLIDPKIVRPPNLPKDLGRYVSRRALTEIVDVLSMGEFYALRKDNRSAYTVTTDKLGVYRPTEHIDNPKNIKPDPPDPRAVDPDFEDWVKEGDKELQVDHATSMKNYIFKARTFMCEELNRAAARGRTPEGMRLFGGALHVLEDYFAHSNFVELSLRKAGEARGNSEWAKVLPWTSPAECRHRYPVVTGMFGSTDVIASLAEPIAHKVFAMDGWKFEGSKPGERSDGERIMLILLDEHSDRTYYNAFNNFLRLRDAWARVPGHEAIEFIGWIASAPMRAVLNSYNFVYQQLLLLVGNSVDDAQTLLDDDPNISGSTDPTHSQLAKDHDDHPFHVLAAILAKDAVREVGSAMNARWRGITTSDPARTAAAFFTHPNDSTWQDAIVQNWASKNLDKIKRGQSPTVLQHLHEQHGKEALERIRRVGRYGTDSWDYIKRNYETLFGEKNQVK